MRLYSEAISKTRTDYIRKAFHDRKIQRKIVILWKHYFTQVATLRDRYIAHESQRV